MTMTACGIAFSIFYYNWTLIGIWMTEGLFLLGKIISVRFFSAIFQCDFSITPICLFEVFLYAVVLLLAELDVGVALMTIL